MVGFLGDHLFPPDPRLLVSRWPCPNQLSKPIGLFIMYYNIISYIIVTETLEHSFIRDVNCHYGTVVDKPHGPSGSIAGAPDYGAPEEADALR